MAYAIFKSGGKQYRVAEGDIIEVEKLVGEPGAEARFENVLFHGEGSEIKLGKDLGSTVVVGEVVAHFKAPKVVAFKFRRRKGYHRTVGHRQNLTRVKITSIG
jgi:large subunit ribosomal protein L21